mmetsp:Transcript_33286/g.46107  ORF Transcript_33286/g.46107 Transcript_33286/m.46107 type:complete len:264 (-) Transcript_33286:390-1181(-)
MIGDISSDNDDEPNTETSLASQIKTNLYHPASIVLSRRHKLADFSYVESIGLGRYSRVDLVRHNSEDRYFALKSMRKVDIIRNFQLSNVMNEKAVLIKLSKFAHPNVINLIATFNDTERIYLLTEYSSRGDLFKNLVNANRFSDSTARFYAANVIIGLGFLNENGILHRDLKPENILICSNGYLKLADFGFAKEFTTSKTWSLLGTPEYMAPEIIQKFGHGKAADWWSLGVLIYHMLVGYANFFPSSKLLDTKMLSIVLNSYS